MKKEFIAWSPNVIPPFTTQQVLTTNGRIYSLRNQDIKIVITINDKRNGIGSLSTKKQQKVRLIITFLKFLDKISTAYNKFKKKHKEQKKSVLCTTPALYMACRLPLVFQHSCNIISSPLQGCLLSNSTFPKNKKELLTQLAYLDFKKHKNIWKYKEVIFRKPNTLFLYFLSFKYIEVLHPLLEASSNPSFNHIMGMMKKGKSLEGFPPITQLVFFGGEISPNFDLKNMISTYIKIFMKKMAQIY